MVYIIEKNFLKVLKKKNSDFFLWYPKVGFSGKVPWPLKKAESHFFLLTLTKMTWIFKKFNKFLKRKCLWP